MDTTKLREALAELQLQRDILDAAIVKMQDVLGTLNGAQKPVESKVSSRRSSRKKVHGSYVDDSVVALTEYGHPLRIMALCEKINELRGTKVERNLFESGLGRHITTPNKPQAVL